MNSTDEADRLMADYLAGALDRNGEGRLHGILQADPGRLRELASLVQLDGMLRAMGDSARQPELLLQQIEARLSDDPQMVDGILRRLQGQPGPGGPSPRPRRRIGVRPSHSAAALWVAMAAGALFAFVLFLRTRERVEPVPAPRPTVNRAIPSVTIKPEVAPVGEPPSLPQPPDRAPAPAPKPEEPSVPKREPSSAPAVMPESAPSPVPAPKPAPPPPAPGPSTQPTVSVVARIERVHGEVRVLNGVESPSAREGASMVCGMGIRTTTRNSRVSLVLSDGTRLELEGETEVSQLFEKDATGKAARGKPIVIAKGIVTAQIPKQPVNQPMIFSTPQAEAKVLGTTLRLIVDPGEKGATRLEVAEGKVRLTRSRDGKFADVSAGQTATASSGVDLSSKPIPGGLWGTVGYWRFDERGGVAALDASGNGNPGSFVAGARRNNGKVGLALELDGTRDYVSVPDSAILNPGPALWTVAAWIRKKGPDQETVLFKDDGNFTHYYWLAVGSRAVFSVSAGDTPIKAQGSTSINDGNWHHVAGVRSAPRTLQVYIDGVLDGTKNVEGAAVEIQTTSPLKIGSGITDAGLHPFGGSIDEVRVFNRALSAEEIKRLYLGR